MSLELLSYVGVEHNLPPAYLTFWDIWLRLNSAVHIILSQNFQTNKLIVMPLN